MKSCDLCGHEYHAHPHSPYPESSKCGYCSEQDEWEGNNSNGCECLGGKCIERLVQGDSVMLLYEYGYYRRIGGGP